MIELLYFEIIFDIWRVARRQTVALSCLNICGYLSLHSIKKSVHYHYAGLLPVQFVAVASGMRQYILRDIILVIYIAVFHFFGRGDLITR